MIQRKGRKPPPKHKRKCLYCVLSKRLMPDKEILFLAGHLSLQGKTHKYLIFRRKIPLLLHGQSHFPLENKEELQKKLKEWIEEGTDRRRNSLRHKKENRMKKKKVIICVAVVVILWIGSGVLDFFRVKAFERPLFCIPTETYDDGGSGHYVGLGYSVDIKGNFMPEEELPGVTEYRYYLFGLEMKSGIRD